MKIPLILASSSTSRLKLLEQILIYPDVIYAPGIDETPLKKELPHILAARLAKGKAMKASEKFDNGFIIAADSVTACGRRILLKPDNDDQVRDCLKLLSGKNHRIYTGVTILKMHNKEIIQSSSKLVQTMLKFKRLSAIEIDEYIESKEGIGKSGGCNIDGLAESFVLRINGSYSNIIGLPLYETKSLLYGMGYIKGVK